MYGETVKNALAMCVQLLFVRLHGTRSTSTTIRYRVVDMNRAQKQRNKYDIPIVLAFCLEHTTVTDQTRPDQSLVQLVSQSNVLTV